MPVLRPVRDGAVFKHVQERKESDMTEHTTDTLRDFWKRIPLNLKCCFLTGLFSGILIHAYMLTNKLPNWDDINNMGSYGVGGEFGRWFLKYVHHLDGTWSVPWLSGIFAIVLISLAACMVVAALELTSITGAVLVPLMMLSFPSMCSLFTFMFTADCYAVAILFSCTAVWLLRRFRYGFLPAGVLLVLGMGIYQAYLCLALGLLVIGLFLDFIREEDVKKTFRRGFLTLLLLLASAAAYTLVSRMIFPELDAYNGLNQMGRIDPARLPRLILRAYKRVAEYFILDPYSFVTPFAWGLNLISCLLAAAGVVWGFFHKKMYKKPLSALLYLFLAASIPLAMGSIIIMAPDASLSMLMLYQYCLLYVFLAALLEKGFLGKEAAFPINRKTAGRILGGAVSLLLFLVAYQNFVVTNQAYFRMDIANGRAQVYYNRLMARIEETEGYRHGDPFIVIGEYGLTDTPDLLGDYAIDGDRFDDLSGVAREDGLLTSGVRQNYMRIYIGVEMPHVEPETEEAIKKTKEYQEMPSYPAQGCVKQIDGIWVLKTCEEIYG